VLRVLAAARLPYILHFNAFVKSPGSSGCCARTALLKTSARTRLMPKKYWTMCRQLGDNAGPLLPGSSPHPPWRALGLVRFCLHIDLETKEGFMSTSERLLKAIQLNAISTLRNRLGSEGFIEWLITPSRLDGMVPVEAMQSGLWQEVSELAEEAISEGMQNLS